MQERNPFVSIAMLVLAMALVAGLAARFDVNSAVAVLCIAIAMIGTWVLLSPQIETLESAVPANGGGRAQPAPTSNVSAFASVPESSARQQLRSTPRVAIGFDTADADRPRSTPPAHLPAFDSDSFHDSVAPVQALGQLPQDAAALHIASRVEPASNISGAYTLGQFEIRASSRRGSDHVILNDPRQDDFVVASAASGRYLVIVVADGEGSAANAHYGSYWSCRLLAQAIDHHLRDGVPGIEKMLERTRDELTQLFESTFTDGTKMRSVATTLVGLIAPVDGGPAAGFRVGDGDIVVADGDAWKSVFGTAAVDPEVVFPRSISAEVAPLEFGARCLLLATDGVSVPMGANAEVSASLLSALDRPVSEVEFDQLMSFPLEEARGDRTAVGVWFSPRK